MEDDVKLVKVPKIDDRPVKESEKTQSKTLLAVN